MSMNDIERYKYWQTQINATYKLLEYFEQDMKVWAVIPFYIRFGKVEYYSILQMNIDHMCGGYERGRMTKEQGKEFRNLVRLAKEPLKLIYKLKEEQKQIYQKELLAREDENG